MNNLLVSEKPSIFFYFQGQFQNLFASLCKRREKTKMATWHKWAATASALSLKMVKFGTVE